jgi:hypothetical protein
MTVLKPKIACVGFPIGAKKKDRAVVADSALKSAVPFEEVSAAVDVS